MPDAQMLQGGPVADHITGSVYLERGQPVTVLIRWANTTRPGAADPGMIWLRPPKRAPRNVLMRGADGSRTVRPFRGLRKIRKDDDG